MSNVKPAGLRLLKEIMETQEAEVEFGELDILMEVKYGSNGNN